MSTRVYGGEIFSQIKVSGQPNVDADSDVDSLTIIAGSNIVLTTDATNDTVTVATTGLTTNQTHTGDATGAMALTVVGINNTLLSGLATGILKNTTTTGVPSIAVAGDFPTLNQNTTGNASTVTTNANLTGHVTSVGNATSLGSFSSAQLAGALTDETGTGLSVFNNSPVFSTQISTPAIISSADLGITPASGSNLNINLNSSSLNVQNIADAASNLVATFRSGDRAIPAANDSGYFSFYNDDSTGTQTEFSRFRWKATDVTSTSKNAQLEFAIMTANTLKDVMYLSTDDDWGALSIGAQPIFPSTTLFDDNHFGHTALQLTGAESQPPIAILNAFSSSTNRAADLDFTWSRGTAYNSVTIVQNGDRLGRINWIAADGVDLDNAAATIQASVDGTPDNNNTPGRLEFLTTNAGSRTPTEKMRITQAGNVIIGGTTGSYNLTMINDSAGKPGVGGLWTVTSDERIKKNIVLADLSRCWDIVKEVPLKRFGWADGVYDDEQVKDRNNLGWLANDVQKVFPKSVGITPFVKSKKLYDGEIRQEVIEDCLDLNAGQLNAAMYGALQLAMKKIEVLEQKIKPLKGL